MSIRHRNLQPRRLVTAQGVYGTVLVATLVFASSYHEESTWDVFWIVLGTMLVFWAAHVYADTVAEHGGGNRGDSGQVITLREAFQRALQQSRGLLLAAVLPMIVVFLGATGVLPEDLAIDLALWSAVAVLAVLGYLAYRDRGVWMLYRILGALGTAAFGGVIILLNSLFH